MPSFSVAVLTAFSSGVLTTLFFARAPTCVCDCSASSEGVVVLDLLRPQPDQCGPQELGVPVVPLREAETESAEAASEAGAVTGEVRYLRDLPLGVVLCASLVGNFWSWRSRSPREVLGKARAGYSTRVLDDGTRWSTPQGSRARQR